MDGSLAFVRCTPIDDMFLNFINVSGMDLKQYRELDRHRWVEFVEWNDESETFTQPGDSGALVFAIAQFAIVPLGTYIGRARLYDYTSVFLGLESFVLEGRF